MFQLLAPLLGVAGSMIGNSKTAQKADDAAAFQMALMGKSGKELEKAYADVIAKVNANPAGYAGTKTKGAAYEPVDVQESQRTGVTGNLENQGVINELVGSTNQATLGNDLMRILNLAPNAMETLGQLGSNAQSLSAGQLPFDTLQDIVSQRSSSAGSLNTPGGSAPATLRDLGMSSLDAMNQGASLFQQVLQGAEAISPISRQIAAPQFYITPGQQLQTDLQQAQLGQQSQQNINNLASQPDPALALASQLQLQGAQQRAGVSAGNAALVQPNMVNYGSNYGQIGAGIGQLLGGQQQGFNSGFNSGFGGGFNPAAHNANALNYNLANTGSAPKAYVV